MNARSLILALVCCVAGARQASAIENAQLQQIQSDIVRHICQERDWLLCYKEDPHDCEAIAGRITKKCVQKTLAGVLEIKEVTYAQDLSTRILGCLNSTFNEEHPEGKLATPECKEPPAHLR